MERACSPPGGSSGRLDLQVAERAGTGPAVLLAALPAVAGAELTCFREQPVPLWAWLALGPRRVAMSVERDRAGGRAGDLPRPDQLALAAGEAGLAGMLSGLRRTGSCFPGEPPSWHRREAPSSPAPEPMDQVPTGPRAGAGTGPERLPAAALPGPPPCRRECPAGLRSLPGARPCSLVPWHGDCWVWRSGPRAPYQLPGPPLVVALGTSHVPQVPPSPFWSRELKTLRGRESQAGYSVFRAFTGVVCGGPRARGRETGTGLKGRECSRRRRRFANTQMPWERQELWRDWTGRAGACSNARSVSSGFRLA